VSDTTPTFMVWKGCGCVESLTAMAPSMADTYAREAKRAWRRGLRTEFLPVETVRTMRWKCTAHRLPKPVQQELPT
jgi:hypothetical protein